MEVLNSAAPGVFAKVDETNVVNDSIVIGEITREKIKSVLVYMESGKAPGFNNITTNLLKAGTDITVNILHGLFNTIGEGERVLEYWTKQLIIKLPKNLIGITLMPIVAKVLGRVLIRRIVAGTDTELRK